ncbi:hypothetical protein CWS20_22715 [Cytobacillus horneckiae]|uniref:Uncharacterized protein n=2 Tax=Cytobacillus horneckiae TaxID=549687 RepID=A0A2N0ZAY0_9BACI|nr:hypothetical protein [Bacillus sp. CRN 9]PKG26663.1 hypothetical protein CWS20_22715 [Cytobacillus horneckiae]
MEKNQQIVIDYLINTGNDFLSDIVELEGTYESIPTIVSIAFEALTEKEKIEVIKESASYLLKNMK